MPYLDLLTTGVNLKVRCHRAVGSIAMTRSLASDCEVWYKECGPH